MNQQLKTIQNFIQQNQQLSPQEKEDLLKSVKDADKEFSITEFKLDRTEKVKRTTAILLEETIEELEQKRKAIEEKNHELEIENALEKVRAIALSMKEPADMPEVCKIIATELDKLGVKEIRNVQTAIFYESKGTYMNYEYYTKHDKTIITEVSYTNHTMHQAFSDQMLKGKGEFFSTYMSKAELPDWIAYQKTTNVFIDTYLEKSSSLNYYWYSLGPVALGISTYVLLTDEEINLFKRFLKVFELAYKIYLDIEQAIAQAKEARIETALERVRAVAMAMKKSEELVTVSEVMYKELFALGFTNIRNAQIAINQGEYKSWLVFEYSDYSVINMKKADSNVSPLLEEIAAEMKKSKDALFQKQIAGKEFEDWRAWRMNADGLNDPRVTEASSMCFYLYGVESGILGISTFDKIPEEQVEILKRFKNVFELSYRRYADVAQAEEQAKEAKIEAALEKVRSRSLAMQKSGELKEVIQVVYDQFVHLNILVEHTGFIIDYKKQDDMHIWLADKHAVPFQLTIPYFDSPHWNSFIEAKEKGIDFFANHFTFDEKNKFYQGLFKLFPVPDEAKEYYFNCPGLAISTVLLDNVGLYIENFSGTSYSDYENNTLMRFGKVFQQTYTRFLDLEKAEAQAREATIEAALEKVRSRSLAMRKSNELGEVAQVVFNKLQELNLVFEDGAVNILLFKEGSRDHVQWSADPIHAYVVAFEVAYTGHSISVSLMQARESGVDFFSKVFPVEEKNEYFNYLFEHSNYRYLPDDIKQMILRSQQYGFSVAFAKESAILIPTNSGRLVPQDKQETLKRFAKVFEQAYVRFLDLQKAEAQARESQIQLALERVRARTMAMYQSTELAETSSVLFQQVKDLGFETWSCGFCIWSKDDLVEVWMGADSGGLLPPMMIPYKKEPTHHEIYKASLRGDAVHEKVWEGEELEKHYEYLRSIPSVATAIEVLEKSGLSLPSRQCYYVGFFKQGYLLLITKEPNAEMPGLSKRFAGVFEQTYTRFLDLQKAEAQSRESQIELSLERVRAKTMAMHNSADVGETAAVMVDELKKLGIETIRCGIGIMHEPGDMEVWTTSTDENNKTNIIIGWLDMNMHPLLHGAFESWRKKNESYSYDLKDDDLINYYNAINHYPGYPISYDTSALPQLIHHNEFAFTEGILFAFSLQQLTDEQRKIFKRFAGVFGQTYRRYLDLKNAEAQARQAKIEAAMEKVRARAMSMQKPDELVEVAEVLRKEMGLLGVEELETSSIYIHNETTHLTECWYAIQQENKLVSDHMDINLNDTEVGKKMLKFYHSNKKQISISMQGEARKEWINYCAEHSKVLVGFYGDVIPDRTYHLYKFSNGYMGAASPGDISAESWDLLQRATSVFSLAYTRFSDLLKAEAQTREAQIETALERVRSRTLAMQKSGELAETSAVLFQQLIHLGISPNRLYISILKDGSGEAEFWITDEDGSKVSMAYEDNLNNNPSFRKMFDGWKQQKKSLIIDMKGKELKQYFKHLSSIHVPFKGGVAQKRRLQYIAYFSKGFIGMASPDEQPPATISLMERFAAVFNLTFTRFNDLQIAEAHAIHAEEDLIKLQTEKSRAEDALIDLRAAQNQLIQKEKMASLGELTAGIAHEIQNPLNFVNNFSEVSKELLEEMKAALESGDKDEAEELANDIIKNLEKINHHGKRADAIVKGMLQHSQRSLGQKELTDINALCDEYLRLSYHGLRAKDKNFNADIKTDFDSSIGKINIIPQDIGRVLLNLYNNAFYSVNEKQKNLSGLKDLIGFTYEPIVSITTKKEQNRIGISVSDNGNGIPQNIVDKIFQPFFTTKPTGQGTGLGLSLSYDIVKVHGGEIKVESKEGEGSAFIIQLLIS